MAFRIPLGLSLLLIPVIAVCAWLGMWQLERMHAKQAMFDQFENAPALMLDEAMAKEMPFAQVQASGRYETNWHLLVDNRILNGRPGVHVLTLFRPLQGPPLLVNRGWLPMPPDRSSLPEVPTSADPVVITGMLTQSPSAGVRLGQPDRLGDLNGPRLITYLSLPDLEEALHEDIAARQLLLDVNHPTGFAGRDWQPAVMRPNQHRGYAVQWFALAAAALVFWLVMVFRPPQRARGQN